MILVTGGNGFIGRALLVHLEKRGMAFRAASRNASPGCVAIGDMQSDIDWSAALHGVDVVIHLAGRAHVLKDEPNSAAAFMSINVDATMSLARQAAALGTRRFIFVSSVKAAGSYSHIGQPLMADDTAAPDDDYGRSKLEAERQLFALGRETGMEVVVIRPPLVYGPGVPANFALLLKWAGSGLPSFFGSVRNRRSLVYVDNLCDLLVRVIDHPHAANQVFFVSDGTDFSTTELFSSLARLQGKKPLNLRIPIPFLESVLQLIGKLHYRERLLTNLQVDIEKAYRLLHWVPPVSSEEGMRLTVGYFKGRAHDRR